MTQIIEELLQAMKRVSKHLPDPIGSGRYKFMFTKTGKPVLVPRWCGMHVELFFQTYG